MAGLRPVEDGQRALRRRGDEALGRRRHHGQLAHAGAIRTNLQRYVQDDEATLARWARAERANADFWKSTEQGAATSVLLATSPLLAGIGGRYFEDCNEAVVDDSDAPMRGVRSYALDPEAATRLWDVSLELLETPVGAAR